MTESTARSFGTEPDGAVPSDPPGKRCFTSPPSISEPADDASRLDGTGFPGFQSILYEHGGAAGGEAVRQAPGYFRDLNLDQVVHAITVGKDEYNLKPFFHDPLPTIEAIRYRHEVMRDLENDALLRSIEAFASGMRLMRQKLAQSDKLYYKYQKERWFLAAAETYCGTVEALADSLVRLATSSRGLRALRDYVTRYAQSERFISLRAATNRLADALASIQYSILIKDSGFRVQKFDSESNYSAEVADMFKKFQRGAVKDYRVKFPLSADMNHIEAKVLEFVARLHPAIFSSLHDFSTRNRDYADPVLTRFDREIQFYIAYMDYMNVFRRAGLRFCYPKVSATEKQVHSTDGFDLALATKLVAANRAVVCNDFYLRGKERILVVSGPNQGGKTTLARAFGQLHHLASIGCPVPGRDAQLLLFDAMYTHFEREETIENLHGKLQHDLVRIHDVLVRATPCSIVIMNEIFTSTTLSDAIFLARKVVDRIQKLDCLCVCVTFLDELASLSEKTVSMMSTVVPDDPAIRTFKVVRRPADGQAYAVSIAEKYRVTYEWLKARIRS